MPKPRIEIAGYRDPDGEVTLAVFIDGQRTRPDILDIVDPGRGYSIQDWAEQIRHAAAIPGASPAWATQVREYYDQGEESEFVDARDYAAMDAQPGTPEAELDPDVWIGEGVPGVDEPGAALVLDNTARAGLALRAVQASAGLGANAPAHTRAAAAVAAYLDVDTATQPIPGEHTGTHIGDLLAGLMHLADARNVDLGGFAPQGPASTLHPQVTMLIAALRTACTQDWAATLQPTWEQVTRLATRRHQEQVRGALSREEARSA